MTIINNTHIIAAQQIIAAAGQAGGVEEVRRLAERGWPENRRLENDSAELRVAIQREAKWVIAGLAREET